MATSARHIFVAVYTSNILVRTGFTLFCYLLPASPILLLTARGFKLRLNPLESLPEKYQSSDLFLLVAIAFISVSLVTRATSARTDHGSATASSGPRRPPRQPYWDPFFGHIWEAVFGGERLYKSVKDCATQGIMSLNMSGSVHHVVLSTSLMESALEQQSSIADFDPNKWTIFKNVFDIPSSQKGKHETIYPLLQQSYSTSLQRQDFLQDATKVIVRNLQINLPNFVTFMPSIVDQMMWERTGAVDVNEEATEIAEAEVDLFALVRGFLGHAVWPSITGLALLENYPDMDNDLRILDSGFYQLALSIPRWFPGPKIVPAYRARSRLLINLKDFHEAMSASMENRTVDATYRDLSDVSCVLSDTAKLYAKHDIPTSYRASYDLAFLHALGTNMSNVSTWLLLRILHYSQTNESFLPELLSETAAWAQATQEASTLAIREPPRVRIDAHSLATKCLLLKSCYTETIRLHTSPWLLRKAKKNMTISESQDDAGVGMKPATYAIRSGEYITIPLEQHRTDPRYMMDPLKWSPHAHVQEASDNSPYLAKIPLGQGDISTDLTSLLDSIVERIALAFVVGVLNLWNIEPPEGKKAFQMPSDGARSIIPRSDDSIRVKIKRKEL